MQKKKKVYNAKLSSKEAVVFQYQSRGQDYLENQLLSWNDNAETGQSRCDTNINNIPV